MNRLRLNIFSLIMVLGLVSIAYGQSNSEITLDDVYRYYKFMPRMLSGLNSMKDGTSYTIQNGSRIEKYSYKTGELEEVLFDAGNHETIDQFSAYDLNEDETKILIETGKEEIYRHSYLATYFVFDMNSGEITPVSRNGKQQLGALSPSGSKAAFVRDNNLYISDLSGNKARQITFDGVKNEIINGAPDWVYEEEFSFSQGFHWSPDGLKIAFYRFDERRVKEFRMTMFGPLYPETYRYKYPKAGEENSLVTIHVYDLETGNTLQVDVGPETDQYIPRIKWTSDPEILSVLRLNRLQNQLDILHSNASTGESKVVFSETNKYYISEASDNTVTYLPDGESFILQSEQSGFFHLYHYNFVSGMIRPITTGDYDIHTFLGYDESKKTLYYTSYEGSSIQRHLYSIGLDGTKKKMLSTRAGSNTASFSATFKYYILTHSSANTPPRITLHNHKGKEIRVLEDNARLRQATREYGFADTEFLTVHTEGGQDLNAWMIKPTDFDPSIKYPLFVFVYGGPESQNVIDSWNYRSGWFQMLVQKGYIVACIDNRGTNGRGEEFRKSTYLALGKLETIDQLESARWFGSLDYIDNERIGIYGGSYGGYMTSLCMTRGNGTFKMGIAVAPVTTWRYYDTVYTERFMRTPQVNPDGYDDNSPINFASGLQGKLLLIHGTGDDNVHFQNSIDFAEALVQANKQFEMQFYPNKSHRISGGNTTFHLYSRVTDFILENL